MNSSTVLVVPFIVLPLETLTAYSDSPRIKEEAVQTVIKFCSDTNHNLPAENSTAAECRMSRGSTQPALALPSLWSAVCRRFHPERCLRSYVPYNFNDQVNWFLPYWLSSLPRIAFDCVPEPSDTASLITESFQEWIRRSCLYLCMSFSPVPRYLLVYWGGCQRANWYLSLLCDGLLALCLVVDCRCKQPAARRRECLPMFTVSVEDEKKKSLRFEFYDLVLIMCIVIFFLTSGEENKIHPEM